MTAVRPQGLRLAAIDLDATLLRDDGSVSERTVAALRAFVASGATVVLASGQPPAQVLRNVSKMGDGVATSYCIASGGATVVWAPTGEVAFRDWVDAAALSRIVPQIRELEPELRQTIEVVPRRRRPPAAATATAAAARTHDAPQAAFSTRTRPRASGGSGLDHEQQGLLPAPGPDHARHRHAPRLPRR